MIPEVILGEKAFFDVELEGSDEDMRDDLQDLIRSAAPNGDRYCSIRAVFSPELYFIYSCDSYDDVLGYDMGYFKQSFKIGDDKEPVLDSEPTKITLTIGPAMEDDDDTYIMLGTDAVAGDKAALGGGGRKRSDLKDSDFAYVEPGHMVNGATPDQYRHYPIYDKSHVRNALARLGGDQSPFAAKAKKKVMAAAKRYGIGAATKAIETATINGGVWFTLPEAGSKSLPARIKDLALKVMGDAEGAGLPALQLTKDATGRTRFVCYPSNNYQDREDELFTAESHVKAIDWYFAQKSFPELWVWHTKGTKFGQVDWMDFVQTPGKPGGVVVASGLIDQGCEALATRLATKDNAMSHGFVGAREIGGTPRAYRAYLDYEISVLPRSAVANYGTAFHLEDYFTSEGATKEMPFTAERKTYLASLGVSDAQLVTMEKATDDVAASLASLGIASKELGVEAPAPAAALVAPVEPTAVQALIEANTKAISDVTEQAKTLILAAQKEARETKVAYEALKLSMTPRNAPLENAVVASKAAATVVDPLNPEVEAAIASGKVLGKEEMSWFGAAMNTQLGDGMLKAFGGPSFGAGVIASGPTGAAQVPTASNPAGEAMRDLAALAGK